MQGYRRHVIFYRVMRWLVGPLLKGYFRVKAEPAPKVAGPYMVVANHTTDFDSLFVALSFPKQMYYVASEHILRLRFLRNFFRYMLAPIPKRKGGADVTTAMQMVRRLRAGHNVMLFAEGNKSFDGLPCPIHTATGGVVKASGATLITYRLTGGYFTHPRWARTLRRGKITGAPVGVYPPEVLAAMTDAQVNQLIAKDIAEDAYARQQAEKIVYQGKRLAEGIENALYLCPACRSIGTIRSEGDLFTCACGLHGRYLPTGYLAGDALPFDTLTAWCAWQRGELAHRLRLPFGEDTGNPAQPAGVQAVTQARPVGTSAGEPTQAPSTQTKDDVQVRPEGTNASNPTQAKDASIAAQAHLSSALSSSIKEATTSDRSNSPAPLLADAGQTIVQILPDHSTQAVAEGTLFLTAEGLFCGTFHCPLAELHGLEVYGRSTIVFSDGTGNRYQVRSRGERSGLKYFEAYQMFKGRRD